MPPAHNLKLASFKLVVFVTYYFTAFKLDCYSHFTSYFTKFTKLIQLSNPAECCDDGIPKGCWSTIDFPWITPHHTQLNQTKLNGLYKEWRVNERNAREVLDQRLADLDKINFGDSWAIKIHAQNVYRREYERYIFDLKMDYRDNRVITQAEAEAIYNGNFATLKNNTYDSLWFWLKTPKTYTESISKYPGDCPWILNVYREAYLELWYPPRKVNMPYVIEILIDAIDIVKNSDWLNFLTKEYIPMLVMAGVLLVTFLVYAPESVLIAYENFLNWLPKVKIIATHLVADTLLQALNWYYGKEVFFDAIRLWTKVIVGSFIIAYTILKLSGDHYVDNVLYPQLCAMALFWFNELTSYLSRKSYEVFNICIRNLSTK